ncbi:MAG TPA: glutamine--fructose-6-phosphate aminotransferase, partial [Amnibacterium sp.]|nr:glutamine--fructose-6-phosphate aminotransferase [Amnibacterium sp.]
MCGIVGYVGGRDAIGVLVGGLKRLEYRGYDSAGVALIGEDGELAMHKRAGKLGVLEADLVADPLPESRTGIGHTRWATHGGPTDVNAHPHLGDHGRLALIHNGIIENYAALRDELLAEGHTFVSETDTEIAAVLLGREYAEVGDLIGAFRKVVGRLHGAFTLLAVHADEPGLVVGARRNSPLVVGLGDGEQFLGSDVAAFVQYTRRALAIGQDQIVAIRPEGIELTDFTGAPVEGEVYEVAWDASAADKGGWSSFMAKEISEEPEALEQTLLGRIHDGLVVLDEIADGFPDDVL